GRSHVGRTGDERDDRFSRGEQGAKILLGEIPVAAYRVIVNRNQIIPVAARRRSHEVVGFELAAAVLSVEEQLSIEGREAFFVPSDVLELEPELEHLVG